MSRAKGINSKLALAFESSYGKTPSPVVGYNMPFNQSKITVKQNIINSSTIRGTRDREQPAIGSIDVSGSVVVPIDQVGFGFWLRAMFGNPSTTGSGDPYTHVFKVTNARQPSLVLEQQYPDVPTYEKFNGCKVNRFFFTYGGDKELTASLDIMGSKRMLADSSFTTNLVDVSLQRFNNFQGTIEEGASPMKPLGIVTEASLNVDFGLDGNTYAIGGGGYRTDLPEGSIQVSGSIKAFFEDAVLLNKAINNDETSLNFKFTNGTHSLQFLMEEVVFQQTSPGVENDKGIYITLPFKAYVDDGFNNSTILVTLVNGQASYAV